MARVVAAGLANGPEANALSGEPTAVSWAQLDGHINQWIHIFRRHGLAVGDRVALVLGNRPATFEILLACLSTGLVAVPMSWRLTAREIAYVLTDSQARAVLTEPGYAPRVAEALGRVGGRPALAAVTGAAPMSGLAPAGPLLVDAGSGEPADQCSGSVLLYTSATTGQPKGVVTDLFTVGSGLDRIERTVAGLGELFGIPSRGRVLLVGPWYHAAQVFFSLFPLLRGNSVVLRQRFDPVATLADLASERVSLCHLVPTQFIRLLGLPDYARAAFTPTHLRRIWHGGAACPVDVKLRMVEWWGPVLTEYYAATEAGIVTTIDSDQWLRRRGSVGRPVPRTQVLIVGDDGAVLPPSQTGTVYVRRSAAAEFHYFNAPEKTASAYLGAGTFTVGDLGHLDPDGYLYLTGRRLDTIISGGVNIYPAEVEATLLSHHAVRDVAVIGVPDAEFGERVLAVVEMAPDARDADDVAEVLDTHCRAHLADFKRPRGYRVVSQLPREPTGKLSRRTLREQYWNQ